MTAKPSVFTDIQAPQGAWEASRRDNFYLSPPGVNDDPRQIAEVWANLSNNPYAQQRQRNHLQSSSASYWEEDSQNGIGALILDGTGWFVSEQDFDFTTANDGLTIVAAIDAVTTDGNVVAKWATANRLYVFSPGVVRVSSDPNVTEPDEAAIITPVTGPQVIAMRWDGTVPELNMYRNSAVSLASAASAAVTTGGSTTFPTLGAQAHPTGNQPFQGKLFEIAIYNTAITESVLQEIIDALNAKWALF